MARSVLLVVALAPLLLALGCTTGTPPEDPGIPRVGGLALDGFPDPVVVAGSTAYVGTQTFPGAKVLAFDVTVPDAPALRATLDLGSGGFLSAIGFSGVNVYVLRDALTEMDPATLTATGRSLAVQGGNGLAIQSGIAYVSSSAGPDLTIVDLGSFAVVATYDHGVGGGPVAVSGNRCYLAGPNVALEVVDVANPTSPAHVGSVLNTYGSTPLDLSVLGADAVLVWGDLGVAQVSLADEAHPQIVEFRPTGGFAEQMAVRGGHAFLSDGDAGVVVLDIADPASPVDVGTLGTSGYAKHVAVAGQYAFVAAGVTHPYAPSSGALDVFDVSPWP